MSKTLRVKIETVIDVDDALDARLSGQVEGATEDDQANAYSELQELLIEQFMDGGPEIVFDLEILGVVEPESDDPSVETQDGTSEPDAVTEAAEDPTTEQPTGEEPQAEPQAE